MVFVLLCTLWFLANLMFLATWGECCRGAGRACFPAYWTEPGSAQ